VTSSRCRLVRDQHVRLVGERHGNHHALALAAGKLVRIGAEPCFGIGNADLVQKIEHALPYRGPPEPLVLDQHLAHLPFDRV